MARLLAPPAPRKGIVTDLDDTLWSGLAGEIGPEGVSWDLASHSQLHGLYQKLLAALAEEGVLIGVASKNDPAVVERTFEREDLLLRADRIFPVEAHWGAKSGSIERILRTWNISADSVVFVDDSAMELAEVAAAHPGMECLCSRRRTTPRRTGCCGVCATCLGNRASLKRIRFAWRASARALRSSRRRGNRFRKRSCGRPMPSSPSISRRPTTPGPWSWSIRRINST